MPFAAGRLLWRGHEAWAGAVDLLQVAEAELEAQRLEGVPEDGRDGVGCGQGTAGESGGAAQSGTGVPATPLAWRRLPPISARSFSPTVSTDSCLACLRTLLACAACACHWHADAELVLFVLRLRHVLLAGAG